MGWLIIAVFALAIGLACFIVGQVQNPKYFTSNLGEGIGAAIAIFVLVLFISVIFCNVIYVDPVFRKPEHFTSIEQNTYELKELMDNQYALVNVNDNNITFIYNDGSANLISNNNFNNVKIYESTDGSIAQVVITKWELTNKFAKSFLSSSDKYQITYELYLPAVTY